MEQTTLTMDAETIARLFGRDAKVTPPVSAVPVEMDGEVQVYLYEAAQ